MGIGPLKNPLNLGLHLDKGPEVGFVFILFLRKVNLMKEFWC